MAELARVVAVGHRGWGCTRESVAAVAAWLGGRGEVVLLAHVHPDHRASAGVARAPGLRPTATVVDGEVRWSS